MHIFNIYTNTVQSLNNIDWKLFELEITLSSIALLVRTEKAIPRPASAFGDAGNERSLSIVVQPVKRQIIVYQVIKNKSEGQIIHNISNSSVRYIIKIINIIKKKTQIFIFSFTNLFPIPITPVLGWRNLSPENSIWNTVIPLLSYSCMFQVEICSQQLEICKSVYMFIVLAIVVETD